MGFWGTGSFENDESLDWLAIVSSAADTAAITGLLTAIPTDDKIVGKSDSVLILCACELAAAARGWPCENFPDNAIGFLAHTSFVPDDNLIANAIAQVARIKQKSELRLLWKETEGLSEWTKALTNLTSRLKKKPSKSKIKELIASQSATPPAPDSRRTQSPEALQEQARAREEAEVIERIAQFADAGKHELAIEGFKGARTENLLSAQTVAIESFRIANALTGKAKNGEVLKYYELCLEQETEFEYLFKPVFDSLPITPTCKYTRESALYRRAIELVKLNSHDEALEAFLLAAKEAPNLISDIIANLEYLWSDGKHEICIQFADVFLQQLVTRPEHVCRVLACRSLALLELKRTDEALADAAKAIETFESIDTESVASNEELLRTRGLMANLYWRRSWLLFKSKKADHRSRYPHDRDQAYKLGRGKITVWQLQFDKAKQARSRGDLKKAELIYKTLTEYDESDLKAWFALAQLYEHMGEPELAKAAHLRLDEFNSG